MNVARLQAKPGWILAGGCLLSFLAAAVNADFMLRVGVSVSHLTGDLSRITAEAIRANETWSYQAMLLGVSVAGFVLGAGVSGFFIHHPNLQLSRPYGRSVIAVGLLLVAAYFASTKSEWFSCFVAAGACGMQNALATRYRGLILRTTHITGLLTDFGQLMGMRLRGHPIETWKLTTPLLLSVFFASGAAAGAVLHLKTRISVTLACGVTYVAGGAIWSILKHRFGRAFLPTADGS